MINYSLKPVILGIFTAALCLGQSVGVPDTVFIQTGDTVSVPIHINKVEDFQGTTLWLVYDRTIVAPKSVIMGDSLYTDYTMVSNINVKDTIGITIYLTGSEEYSIEEDIIANIYFAAVGGPESSSEIIFIQASINGEDHLADAQNGTIVITHVQGCMDQFACNYNSDATVDDGSCEYLDCNNDCGGEAEPDACGNCFGGNTTYASTLEEYSGCRDPENICIPEDGTCEENWALINPPNNCYWDNNEDGIFEMWDNDLGDYRDIICGCMDLEAENYNPDAEFDDNSCDNLSVKPDIHPYTFQLLQNYPNPFNPITSIEYAVPELEMVKIQVYNLNGRLVKTLIERVHNPGIYRVTWDGTNQSGIHLPSGIYLNSMETNSLTLRNKLILLK